MIKWCVALSAEIKYRHKVELHIVPTQAKFKRLHNEKVSLQIAIKRFIKLNSDLKYITIITAAISLLITYKQF